MDSEAPVGVHGDLVDHRDTGELICVMLEEFHAFGRADRVGVVRRFSHVMQIGDRVTDSLQRRVHDRFFARALGIIVPFCGESIQRAPREGGFPFAVFDP